MDRTHKNEQVVKKDQANKEDGWSNTQVSTNIVPHEIQNSMSTKSRLYSVNQSSFTPGVVKTDDMSTTASVQASGWTIGFSTINDSGVQNTCNGRTLFIGWNGGSGVGWMSRTMSGSGIATIKYRNCWSDGSSHVDVYLAGAEISRASVNKVYVVKSFAYTDG